MRQSKAKLIRKVLGLSRHPKAMPKADRWFYRAVKKVYTNTPAPRREAYLDSAVAIRQAITDRLKAQGGPLVQPGVPLV